MSNNIIYIAAAGSGKTSLILNQVNNRLLSENTDKKIGIITYTLKNQENIKVKIVNQHHCMPNKVRLMGWYTFLLDYWIRPFKGDVLEELYSAHIGLYFTKEPSGILKTKVGKYIRTYKKDEPWKKYFTKDRNDIYSDKLSEFAFECYKKNKVDLIERISNVFSAIYIDESQDLSGWDFEIIKILSKSQKIDLVLCADPRQNTYSTNYGLKHKKYNGCPDKYANKCINTSKDKFIKIDDTTLKKSHRCCDDICSFSNLLMEKFPETQACNCDSCEKRRSQYTQRKGMFLLSEEKEQEYINCHSPISLIWDSKSRNKAKTKECLNYAESKGLEYDAVIIYPTDTILKYLSGKEKLQDLSLRKLYVAITRARFTCAIVVPNNFDKKKCNLEYWKPLL